MKSKLAIAIVAGFGMMSFNSIGQELTDYGWGSGNLEQGELDYFDELKTTTMSSYDCDYVENIMWEAANDLLGAIPGTKLLGKLMVAVSKTANNVACNARSESLEDRIQNIAQTQVALALDDATKRLLENLNSEIKGYQGDPAPATKLDVWFTYAQMIEGGAVSQGLPALDYQIAATTLKMSFLVGILSHNSEEPRINDRIEEAAALAVKRLQEQEDNLYDHLDKIESGQEFYIEYDFPYIYDVRSWVRYPNGNISYTAWYECSWSIFNDCRSRVRSEAIAAGDRLKTNKVNEIKSAVISAKYLDLKSKLKNYSGTRETTWGCFNGQGHVGDVTIDWGHSVGDAQWACNKWRGACDGGCYTERSKWNCYKSGHGKVAEVDIWWGHRSADAQWACGQRIDACGSNECSAYPR